jgi:hypothetical protein
VGTPDIYTLTIFDWLNAWMITPCVLSTMPRNIGYTHSFTQFDRNFDFYFVGGYEIQEKKKWELINTISVIQKRSPVLFTYSNLSASM